jgi:hypothetical protein
LDRPLLRIRPIVLNGDHFVADSVRFAEAAAGLILLVRVAKHLSELCRNGQLSFQWFDLVSWRGALAATSSDAVSTQRETQ